MTRRYAPGGPAGTIGVVLWRSTPVERWAVVRWLDGPMTYKVVVVLDHRVAALSIATRMQRLESAAA